jgi:hypothetical protein
MTCSLDVTALSSATMPLYGVMALTGFDHA